MSALAVSGARLAALRFILAAMEASLLGQTRIYHLAGWSRRSGRYAAVSHGRMKSSVVAS